jgi:hypothetical protein
MPSSTGYSIVKKHFQIWDEQTPRAECATIFHRKELGWSFHSRNLLAPKGVNYNRSAGFVLLTGSESALMGL